MAKLLIIEDDSYIAAELRNWLEKEKFTADVSLTGDDGLFRLRTYYYDLAIVDWNLPDMEGVEICQLIRKENENLPLLMLTSRKDLADRIEGLDSGALDYMVKPCALPELSARIRALLRRQPEFAQEKITFLDINVFPLNRQAFCVDTEIDLSQREFDILHLLVKNKGKSASFSQIAHHIGTEQDEAMHDKIKNFVSLLRKRLKQANSTALVQYGSEGYQLKEGDAPQDK